MEECGQEQIKELESRVFTKGFCIWPDFLNLYGNDAFGLNKSNLIIKSKGLVKGLLGIHIAVIRRNGNGNYTKVDILKDRKEFYNSFEKIFKDYCPVKMGIESARS